MKGRKRCVSSVRKARVMGLHRWVREFVGPTVTTRVGVHGWPETLRASSCSDGTVRTWLGGGYKLVLTIPGNPGLGERLEAADLVERWMARERVRAEKGEKGCGTSRT